MRNLNLIFLFSYSKPKLTLHNLFPLADYYIAIRFQPTLSIQRMPSNQPHTLCSKFKKWIQLTNKQPTNISKPSCLECNHHHHHLDNNLLYEPYQKTDFSSLLRRYTKNQDCPIKNQIETQNRPSSMKRSFDSRITKYQTIKSRIKTNLPSSTYHYSINKHRFYSFPNNENINTENIHESEPQKDNSILQHNVAKKIKLNNQFNEKSTVNQFFSTNKDDPSNRREWVRKMVVCESNGTSKEKMHSVGKINNHQTDRKENLMKINIGRKINFINRNPTQIKPNNILLENLEQKTNQQLANNISVDNKETIHNEPNDELYGGRDIDCEPERKCCENEEENQESERYDKHLTYPRVQQQASHQDIHRLIDTMERPKPVDLVFNTRRTGSVFEQKEEFIMFSFDGQYLSSRQQQYHQEDQQNMDNQSNLLYGQGQNLYHELNHTIEHQLISQQRVDLRLNQHQQPSNDLIEEEENQQIEESEQYAKHQHIQLNIIQSQNIIDDSQQHQPPTMINSNHSQQQKKQDYNHPQSQQHQQPCLQLIHQAQNIDHNNQLANQQKHITLANSQTDKENQPHSNNTETHKKKHSAKVVECSQILTRGKQEKLHLFTKFSLRLVRKRYGHELSQEQLAEQILSIPQNLIHLKAFISPKPHSITIFPFTDLSPHQMKTTLLKYIAEQQQ